MDNNLYAHTPNDAGRWHLLRDHLERTAKMAGEFGEAFGAREICETLGWAHDAGKANPAFQEYLWACHEGRQAPKAPHAAPSAQAAYSTLQSLTLAILGHHAGLHDPGEAKGLLKDGDTGGSAARELLGVLECVTGQPVKPPAWADSPLKAEMFLRMCFSALVDADYLDTEAHFQAGRIPSRGDYPALCWYRERLAEHMASLSRAGHGSEEVRQVRHDVLNACREAAAQRPGAFRLTVPTGGGKTLAGLTFALEHAARHGQSRIIVAIPFTSIIDQTAQVYGDVFGPGNLLEHHSAYEEPGDDEAASREEYRRRLAAENWDCPLIVTTTVQFFESLLSNRPSKCRKIHNIARSVIVLDEVQTLPVPLLLPILDVLKQLVEYYGCTVVFCTATQPDFSGLEDNVLTRATEIVSQPERHFESLRRVRYQRLDGPVTHEDLARKLDDERQALCVLNSRPDAVRVAQACRPGEDLFHLSTLMCPDHRKKVLAEVRRRLREDLPVRLVTTQVVEAGVDLDFPLVMRAIGPLDRIVQVAGRCNREGLLTEPGRCIVFELEDGKSPKGPYLTGTRLTQTLVNEQPDRLDQPDVVAAYFRELYQYGGAEQGKGREIQNLRSRLHYRSVAEKFHLIDEASISIVVMKYASDLVEQVLREARHTSPRDIFRRLAPFTVPVPVSRFRKWQNDGTIYRHDTGAWLYTGAYTDLYGVGEGSLPDPTDLIA